MVYIPVTLNRAKSLPHAEAVLDRRGFFAELRMTREVQIRFIMLCHSVFFLSLCLFSVTLNAVKSLPRPKSVLARRRFFAELRMTGGPVGQDDSRELSF